MKRSKRMLAVVLAALMVLPQMPLSGNQAQAATKVKKITLNKKMCVLKKGKSVKLKATINPKKAKGSIKWKTSNKKIASVTAKGVVKAKKNGKTTITAVLKGKKATCKVIVGTPVTSVKIKSDSKVNLSIGESSTIKASVLPQKATIKSLTYKTSDKKIATVSKKGVIKAVAAGTTKIKVMSNDGSNKSSTVTVTVKKPVAYMPAYISVTGITMNETEKTLNINETAALKAVIAPENASDKTVNWSSSDANIVKVDDKGNITGVSKGTAVVSASTANNAFSAKCVVTVQNLVIATTNTQIENALEQKSLDCLYLKTNENTKLTIPEGHYSDVELVVDMPNGEVENNATFSQITINQIAKNTYYENATGNQITVNSSTSHIILNNVAMASIKVGESAQNTLIENNGTLNSMEVQSSGEVVLEGTSKDTVPTSITNNASVITNQNLQVNSISKFTITIRPGAENTTISVDIEANMPNINGLGMIPVTISATGAIETLIGNNTGADANAVDVAFAGNIADESENALADANVYVVPYSANYDVSGIADDSKTVKLTTNAEGKYATDSIKTGNYILVAHIDGYSDVVQNLVITSTYGSTYTNEKINMLPASWEGKKGAVSGTIIDSKTGESVADMTIRARKGKKNLIGSPIAETKTDSDGKYIFNDLEVGYYTIQVVDMIHTAGTEDAYITTDFNVLVSPDTENSGQGIGISTNILVGQVRFILTWGDEKSGAVSDADSHLSGPSVDTGRKLHTWFSEQTEYVDDVKYADLDLDDTTYEGPETTTIYKETPGTYSFYVHDFTNGGSTTSDQLSKSSVKVEVYSGSFKMATYYMPQEAGTLWHVCDYESTSKKLTNVNTVDFYTGDLNDIGLSAVDIYKNSINNKLNTLTEYASLLTDGKSELEAKIEDFKSKLSTDDESVLSAISDEVLTYYNSVYYEFENISLSEKKEDGSYEIVDDYYLNNASNIINVYSFEEGQKDYKINTDEDTTVTSATPADDAVAAFKVTVASGRSRIYQIYQTYNLYDVSITSVKENGNSLDFYDDGGDVYIYQDFSFEDIEVTFSSDKVTVKKDTEEKYITISVGDTSRTFWFYQRVAPSISLKSDSTATIYGTQRTGGSSQYVYGSESSSDFKDDYVLSVPDGYTCEIDEVYDNGDSYSIDGRVKNTDSEYYFSIYYYNAKDRCTIYSLDTDPYCEYSIDNVNDKITFEGTSDEKPSEFDIYTDDSNASAKFVAGSKADDPSYIGKIEVTYKLSNGEMLDYTRTYDVYFTQIES